MNPKQFEDSIPDLGDVPAEPPADNMDEEAIMWYTGYQEAIDPESDDYDAEVHEFIKPVLEYAIGCWIPDGDQDGYHMIAQLSGKRIDLFRAADKGSGKLEEDEGQYAWTEEETDHL
jgi:hypothetical protein